MIHISESDLQQMIEGIAAEAMNKVSSYIVSDENKSVILNQIKINAKIVIKRIKDSTNKDK